MLLFLISNSLYYARLFKGTEKRMLGWKMNGYLKTVAGGSILALIYFVFPPLFGEGYNSVKMVANGSLVTFADNTTLFSVLNQNWGLIVFSGLIVILKPIAAGITIGSGGNGGNFAPSLFAGSYLGFFFSKLLNSTPRSRGVPLALVLAYSVFASFFKSSGRVVSRL